nr:tetratricopeptide repeat protein [uncultured Dongia sp.]
MPILALAVIGLQIFMAVHVIRNGKTCWWISLILFFPLIGSLVYFFVEVMPTLQTSPKVVRMDQARWHRAMAAREREVKSRSVDDVINTGSINDKISWAEECIARELYLDAIRLYESAREGHFVNAADILIGLARARFENGNYAKARQVLRDLAAAHPNSFAQERTILGARAVAAAGDLATALSELEALLGRSDSLEARRLEARFYYAEILWKQGAKDRALAELTEVIRHGKLFNMTEEEEHWVRRAGEVQAAIA